MSALPPKADIIEGHEKGLLMTQSGHSVDQVNRRIGRFAAVQHLDPCRAGKRLHLDPYRRQLDDLGNVSQPI